MATIAIRKRAHLPAVGKKIKDHSNDPFVVKKVKASKKLVNKYGLPKGLK